MRRYTSNLMHISAHFRLCYNQFMLKTKTTFPINKALVWDYDIPDDVELPVEILTARLNRRLMRFVRIAEKLGWSVMPQSRLAIYDEWVTIDVNFKNANGTMQSLPADQCLTHSVLYPLQVIGESPDDD